MKKIKLGIVSMGCDKNTYDTEQFLSAAADYVDFTDTDSADYIFLNTCAFLASARTEMEEYLAEFKNKKVILAGCFQKLYNQEFQDQHPQVVGWADPKTDPDFLDKFLDIIGIKNKNLEKKLITTTPKSHAFVKIAEGCNRNCSFCMIPYLTGAYHSRETEDILTDIEDLISASISEIILVAQDTGIYGHDLEQKTTLTELLTEIENIEGDFWIRILYLYPNGVTEDLLSLIVDSDKILPYFDFPLQHFSPKILADMNRAGQDTAVIKRIRQTIPDAILRTTVMVGYPTETPEDFTILKKELKKNKIDHTSVFIYSSEPHTAAGEIKNPISQKEKLRRENKILEIGYKNRQIFFSKILNTEQICLVDAIEDGVALCRSWHFAPSDIDGYIYVEAPAKLQAGDIINVELTHTEYENIYGKIV